MEVRSQAARDVIGQVEQVILGKEERIREIMTAFLAGGHVLLEDIPDVGKTTLAMAFSRAMGLSYRRVQFTPDVLPSDLTGFSIYRREEEKFVYQPAASSATCFWRMRSTGHPPRLSLRFLRCRARSMTCLSRTRCMSASWS